MPQRFFSWVLQKGRRRTVAFSFGLSLFVFSVLFIFPLYSRAAGLVDLECGVDGRCQICDLVSVANKFINFAIIELALPLAALSFGWAGLLYITSGGGSQADQAQEIFWKVGKGLIFVLAGWFIVHLIMQAFVANPSYAPWSQIACEEQPKEAPIPAEVACPRGTTLRYVDGDNVCSPDFVARIVPPEGIGRDNVPRTSNCSAAAATPFQGMINAEASADGVDPVLVRSFVATESGFVPTATQTTQAGTSYGLMQILVPTARSTNLPELSGKTDAQVAALLKDPAENIRVGTKYLASLLTKYGGNQTLAAAAFNGGAGANLNSVDCPGGTPPVRRWQCPWDSKGCWGTTLTNCTPNERPNHLGFGETRRYVNKIQANKVCS